MATEAPSGRRPLTREVVVDLAVATADAGGLEAVSFRRLAADLGVTPMALYRYVAGKDELLGAMLDRIFEEFEFPADPQADWREQLREMGRAFRRLVVAHPALAGLHHAGVEGGSPNGLRIVEVVLAALRQAGFSREEAALLQGSLERNVLAIVLLEVEGAASTRTPEEREAHIREQRARLLTLPPQEFPNVVESADELCGPADPDVAFEFTLDLLMGGLEKLLERPRS
jgi:AcrR family transcriptional regulator